MFESALIEVSYRSGGPRRKNVLTESQISSIVYEYETLRIGQREIARKYKISQGLVHKILAEAGVLRDEHSERSRQARITAPFVTAARRRRARMQKVA